MPKFSYSSYKNTSCNCKKGDRCCCEASNEPCVKDPCAPRVKLNCEGNLIPTHAMHVPLALTAVDRVQSFLCPPCPPPYDCLNLNQFRQMGHPLYHQRYMTTLSVHRHPVHFTKPPVPYWAYLFRQYQLMAAGPTESCPRETNCDYTTLKNLKGYKACGENLCKPVWGNVCQQCRSVQKEGQLQYIKTMARR